MFKNPSKCITVYFGNTLSFTHTHMLAHEQNMLYSRENIASVDKLTSSSTGHFKSPAYFFETQPIILGEMVLHKFTQCMDKVYY